MIVQAQPTPVDLMLTPHHGGRSANTTMLYAWALPRTAVVSKRVPSSDALTPLERRGTPVMRTWERAAIHFQWRADRVITEGFLDHHDQTRSRPHIR